jgi:peptidoglycan/xylan/chitin deacetylase (PgdA/CDA1 family)
LDPDAAVLVSEDTQPGDGWEAGPNPVAEIIRTRTLQTSAGALLTLALLRAVLPAERFRPLVPLGGVAVGAGLSAYFVATFHARIALGAPLVTRLGGERAPERAIALTFDDGPHPQTTPRLLDILAEHEAKATFFLVGERASAYPALVRRIREEGHAIGVHGLRHRTMALQNASAIEADLKEAVRRIEAASGAALPDRLLRPPYMFKSVTLGRTARRLGWTLVSWSLDPRDYDPQTPASLARRVISRLTPRDIVLLHERPGDETTLNALPEVLTYCQRQGIALVPLTRHTLNL